MHVCRLLSAKAAALQLNSFAHDEMAVGVETSGIAFHPSTNVGVPLQIEKSYLPLCFAL